ncbi:MAG: amidophosphoribosyltransferase [bacterium]|nr:amidophosphoribosyltransferase [bacterium]
MREFWSGKEMCGIFGIYGAENAAKLTYLGLFALQHRGQESAGIVTSDGENMEVYKQMGLVQDVFSDEVLERLKGEISIGHVRYSTFGESSIVNAQPLVVGCSKGKIAIAHNGNLVNGNFLRKELEAEGAIFQTTVDSEVIVHLLARSRKREFLPALTEALSFIKGSYSLIIMTPKELIGIRDPFGFHPLCLGRLIHSYILASESCALDLVNAKFLREVMPGEMVVINESGITSKKIHQSERNALCIFEAVYFARPDSDIFGENMHKVRMEMGRQLAREKPASADLVVPIPDSGVSAAIGYAEESGIHYNLGLVRNRYVGRTFISPTQTIRNMGVQIKLNPIDDVLSEKRVVVIDDSIVRGTTSRKILRLIREAGAKEIHLRISSPPIKHPCFYGIDTPTREELLASNHTIEEIREYMGVDSLGYLSISGLLNSVSKDNKGFCTACFDGNYPIR